MSFTPLISRQSGSTLENDGFFGGQSEGGPRLYHGIPKKLIRRNEYLRNHFRPQYLLGRVKGNGIGTTAAKGSQGMVLANDGQVAQ
jgi:hypothetical protein